MAKTPTAWSPNAAATTNQRAYDSSSTVYNSSSLTYDGIVSGQSPITPKVPAAWSMTAKADTGWVFNTGFGTPGPYDATGVYDVVNNYDDITQGQSPITPKVPTAWSAA